MECSVAACGHRGAGVEWWARWRHRARV